MTTDFALYIHYPFCLSKCPYCDFNSHTRFVGDDTQWFEAYLAAMNAHQLRFNLGQIKSIFFGGGTPSLMSAGLIERILQAAQSLFGFSDTIEITLEANPTSSEAQKFQDFAFAGINRLSMGVQALNDIDLRKLGRTHSAQEAIKAYELAKKYFQRTSFDLIYARPGQTLKQWRTELLQAVTLSVNHISLYQLTIEAGTRFADWYQRGKIVLPLDEVAEEMYFLTDEILSAHGYINYEISNYATQGNACQHNLNYWRYEPYIGIGPGAHGRVALSQKGCYLATETEKSPEKWLNNPTEFSKETLVTGKDYDLEYLIMNLRLQDGGDLNKLQTNSVDMAKIAYLKEDGFIAQDDHSLKVLPKGRPLLDRILREICLV